MKTILWFSIVLILLAGCASSGKTPASTAAGNPPPALPVQPAQSQEVASTLDARITPALKAMGDLTGQVGELKQQLNSQTTNLQKSQQEALNGLGQEQKKESTATRDLVNSALTENRRSYENFNMSVTQLGAQVKLLESHVATFSEREKTIRETYQESLKAQSELLRAQFDESRKDQKATWEQAQSESRRSWHTQLILMAMSLCLLLSLWFEDSATHVPDKTWVLPLWVAFCASLVGMGLCVVSLVTGVFV